MKAGVTFLRRAREVFRVEEAALRKVRGQLNSAFADAVATVVAALEVKGKVVVVGIGKSGNIGQKIAATLTSTGSTSVVLNSVDALHGDLGIVNDGDVILALSYSGESEELIHLLPAFKRFNLRVIAMTGNSQSTVGRHSDVVLNVRIEKEACPFGLAPTSSTTAMLVMGDALAMTVADARGWTRQEFAKRHPAGAIGRALLSRIDQIMRKGERNAVAPANATVMEALLVMTRAKSGSVSVVSAAGKLAGVFTDGDLRRHTAKGEEILSRRLADVMTRHPIVVREESLAVEALKLFDAHNIDDLIVVNSKREPVGMIDSQDLPKLKLM